MGDELFLIENTEFWEATTAQLYVTASRIRIYRANGNTVPWLG